jgi:hypothetical protein
LDANNLRWRIPLSDIEHNFAPLQNFEMTLAQTGKPTQQRTPKETLLSSAQSQ